MSFNLQPRSKVHGEHGCEKHHATSSGIWLVYAKKHTGIPSLTYNEAVEEALCFGWIDSLVHPSTTRLYKQIFTPRKAVERVVGAQQETRREADHRRAR